jgi:multidrug resistance efflux pump
MRRMILVPVLIVVALMAIAGGVGYWIYDNYYFYSTDDAQVSGQMLGVSSPAAGDLKTFSVAQGDKVTAGQTLAVITTTSATGTKTNVTVTSPISGVIVQTSAIQGQSVTPGLSLAQITNLDNQTVMAYVDENTINNVKLNQDVDVHIDAFKGTTYSGHVKQIVQAAAGQFSLLPTSDNASGNFTKVGQRIPVIVTLDGKSGDDIVPGMSAEVTIHLH